MEEFGSFIRKEGNNTPVRERDNEYMTGIPANNYYLKGKFA